MGGQLVLVKEAHGKEKAVWRLRVSVIDKDGKRLQPIETFHGSERDARRRLAEKEREERDKAAKEKEIGGPILDDEFKLWVEAPARNGRAKSASTRYQDTKRYEKYIKPQFGHKQMAGIKPEEIETFYHKLSFHVAGETQRPLSETTIHRVHEIFQAIYNYTLRKGLIEKSPFASIHRAQVRLPDPSAPRMTDVAALLAYLQQNDPELFCAVSIAAVIGARRSEIIGLHWDDFDPANDALRLTHGLIAVPKQGRVETSTKTGETIAGGISIGADLSAVLVRMKTRRLEEGVSPKKIGKTYIFAADKEGIRSWHPDTISTRLRKACEAAGQDRARITLKDLRTFVASELVQQPFGLQIARDVLRHTNVKTTLRHYLAAEKKRNREATGKLAGSLGIATELVLAFQVANEDQE